MPRPTPACPHSTPCTHPKSRSEYNETSFALQPEYTLYYTLLYGDIASLSIFFTDQHPFFRAFFDNIDYRFATCLLYLSSPTDPEQPVYFQPRLSRTSGIVMRIHPHEIIVSHAPIAVYVGRGIVRGVPNDAVVGRINLDKIWIIDPTIAVDIIGALHN